MSVVRFCEVDQVPEDLCGGCHMAVDVSAAMDEAQQFLPSNQQTVAAFSAGRRVLPPTGTKEVVLWDLDSTLRDTRQRHHLLPRARPDLFKRDPARGWLEYALAGELDEPFPAAVLLYKMLLWQRLPGSYARRHQTHIVSGSDDGARAETLTWLRRHGLWCDALRLRTPEDREVDGDAGLEKQKITYVQDLQASGLVVTLFGEDWPPLARAIEIKTGVPVFVLNPMYELLAAEGATDLDARDEADSRSEEHHVVEVLPEDEEPEDFRGGDLAADDPALTGVEDPGYTDGVPLS